MSASKSHGIPYTVARRLVCMTERTSKPTPASVRDEAMRTVLRSITAVDHNGVQRQTAKALAVPASTLNGYVNGREGNTMIADAVAAYLGRTVDEIVEARGDLTALRSTKVRGAKSRAVCFGELPMWPELLRGAQALAPDLPAWCWRDAAESVVWVRAPVTSAMVRDVARFLLEHTPPHA
jgi:hypothetical protein